MLHKVFFVSLRVTSMHAEFDHVPFNSQVTDITLCCRLITVFLITFFFISVSWCTMNTSNSASSRCNYLILIELTVSIIVLTRVDIVTFFTSWGNREDFIDLILIILIVFIIVAIDHVDHLLRTRVRAAHLVVDPQKDFHVSLL